MNRLITQYGTITQNNIPVITCYPDRQTNLPLVLLNHGTTGNRHDTLDMAVMLASRGHFCVNIDAVLHGDRANGKMEEWLEPSVYKNNYLTMLLQMAKDMQAIVEFYDTDEHVDTSRVGMTGLSQGGYVTFMTLTKTDRITAAAPIIGSPDLEDKFGFSPDWSDIPQEVRDAVTANNPLHNFDMIYPSALLIQSSIEDDIVPVTGTRRLNEKLRPMYASCPEKYEYIEYPDIGHVVTREMKMHAVDWLTEMLS